MNWIKYWIDWNEDDEPQRKNMSRQKWNKKLCTHCLPPTNKLQSIQSPTVYNIILYNIINNNQYATVMPLGSIVLTSNILGFNIKRHKTVIKTCFIYSMVLILHIHHCFMKPSVTCLREVHIQLQWENIFSLRLFHFFSFATQLFSTPVTSSKIR